MAARPGGSGARRPPLVRTVSWGDAIRLCTSDGASSVGFAVRGRGNIRVFGKIIDACGLVGKPFGQVFEVNGDGALSAVAGPLLPRLAVEDEAAGPGADNRELDGSVAAQALSQADIEALQASGASGAEVFAEVLRGSKTFSGKTAHSRAKWLKAKKGKWLRRAQLLPASSADVAAAAFNREGGTHGAVAVRPDTLAMALCLADVRSGCHALVVDDAGGSVAAAAWRRMGADGRMVLPYSGAKPWMPHLDTVAAADATAERGAPSLGSVVEWRSHDEIIVVPWAEVAAAAPDGSLVLAAPGHDAAAADDDVAAGDGGAAGPASTPAEASSSQPAAAVGDTSPGRKRPRPDDGAAPAAKRPARDEPLPARVRSLLASGLDAAVLAPASDPLEHCLAAARLLRPGACLVAVGQTCEPLARAAAALRDHGLCHDVTVRTLFKREIQVQPHATRPEMVMHADPGWILAAQVTRHPYSAVRPSEADIAAHFRDIPAPPSTAPVAVALPPPAAPAAPELDV